MHKNIFYTISLLLAGCTSLSAGQERLPPPAPANERVTLHNNSTQTLRQRMGNQASEINRKRNIERFDGNGPAMTPNTLRPLLPLAPVGSERHFLYWPLQQQVRPLPPANGQ